MSSCYELRKITLFSLMTSRMALVAWEDKCGHEPISKFASFDLDIPHIHRIHTMPFTGSQTPHGLSHCQYGTPSPKILPSVPIPRPCE